VTDAEGDLVEGVVERLRDESEGEHRRVVRFVLRTADGRLHAVEMRGEQLDGVLNDGDSVSVGDATRAADGTLRPRTVRNASTGSLVAMSTRPFHRRLLGLGLSDIWKATVSAVVGAAVGLAFTVFESQPSQGAIPGEPTADDAWPELIVPILLLLVVLALAALRRWRRGRWSPVLIGLALGLMAAAALIALAA
jgi:hypothetical protein